MALIDSVCLIYSEECSLHKYSNKTIYGTPNQDRNQAAEILIAAHVTVAENNEPAIEEFITIDSIPYLTKLEYDINTTEDGHYRYERLRFQFWSNVANYVKKVVDVNNIITTYPSLIYYQATGKFYKALENHTNIAPDSGSGSINWQEVTDFTIAEIRLNPNIEAFVSNLLFDCRSRKCTKNELVKLDCACMDDIKKLLPFLRRKILLTSARSKADDQKPEQAETIIRVLDKMCGNCQ
jgi:hypothetical protein